MLWDRMKLLVIIGVVFGFLIAKQRADYPMDGLGSAIREQLIAKQWLLWVAGIEVLRQIHYLISENSAGYNSFWVNKVWGGWDRFWSRRNPWLRFRLNRLVKRTAVLAILAVIASAAWRLSIIDTITAAPSRVWRMLFSTEQSLPFIFQLLFILLFVVMQIFAMYWAMGRGGIETLQPEEVDVRFDDIWGQDRVLTKVKENLVFLEKPQEIEARGGHVPGGHAAVGASRHGKTMIAKAVAGETGRPYVFVEPAAFQQTFVGIGPMKVRNLFNKLRKLSLRHGGVIVFFDEADSLGNRGLQVAGGGGKSARFEQPGCNGAYYLDPGVAATLRPEPSAVPDAPARGGWLRNNIVMGGMGMAGGSGALQSLLTEISGLEKPRGWMTRNLRKFLGMPAKRAPKYRILIMMATNAPDVLDAALLRPGRIDRVYQVGYPSLDGRKVTYRNYLKR